MICSTLPIYFADVLYNCEGAVSEQQTGITQGQLVYQAGEILWKIQMLPWLGVSDFIMGWFPGQVSQSLRSHLAR